MVCGVCGQAVTNHAVGACPNVPDLVTIQSLCLEEKIALILDLARKANSATCNLAKASIFHLFFFARILKNSH